MLLAIVHLAGRVSGRTRLQKLAFLVQQEAKLPSLSSVFEFEPYYYGPYSEELDRVVSQLVREGYVTPDPYAFVADGRARLGSSFSPTDLATDEAKLFLQSLPAEDALRLMAVVKQYRFEPLPRLLDYVYRVYPEMAKNAESRSRA